MTCRCDEIRSRDPEFARDYVCDACRQATRCRTALEEAKEALSETPCQWGHKRCSGECCSRCAALTAIEKALES